MIMSSKIIKKIPEGYKQTEIGVIPEDWKVKRLDKIFSITAGRDLIKESYSQIRDNEHPFPIYSNSQENKGLYGYTGIARYKKNSITITARGTIGRSNARDHEFDAIGRLLVLLPKEKLNCIFISEYLNNKVSFSIESTGVPQLTAPQASKYFVSYPNSEEQTAIATVLSDTYALIEHLEKLIAKKKAIKQGAMQQLLTGKKRLPGFSGNWEAKKLGDIFLILAGGDLIKEHYSQNKDDKYCYPIYSNSLTNKGLYGFSKLYRHDENCITVTARGTIGVANARDHKFDAIGRVLILRPLCELSCFFVSEYLNNRVAFSIESTGVPQLTAPQISKYEIVFPGYIEQTAIATILADMDAEIEKLEQKRDKYTMLKQGIMQQLLTGRIRIYANN